MDNFTKCEFKGREIFKKKVFPMIILKGLDQFLTFSDYKFEVFDAKIITTEAIYIVEIKYRNFGSNRYNSILMEANKHFKMKEIAGVMKEENPDKDVFRLYVSIYTDNVCRVVTVENVNKDNVRSNVLRCPSTTADRGLMVEKEVFEIGNRESIVYKFDL